MSTPSWTRSSRARRAEQGTGVVSSFIGAAMFLVLVLFAVQVLFGLYSTSVVTAVTYDAATTVAGATGPGATGDAEANARNQLGRYARDVEFTWDVGADVVRLTVRARRPTVLPRALVDGAGLGDIERTVLVRVERVR
ncbi:MAG: hypothetical protein ABIW46_07760 [Acidimicrobiales bacterium]